MKLPNWTKKELKLPKRSPKINSSAPKVPKVRPGLPKVLSSLKVPELSRPKLARPKVGLKMPKTSLRIPKTKLTAPKTGRTAAPKALGELKAPAALGILWRQLREQRLLPVVGLLLIGLVAIPLLLGRSSKDHSSATTAAGPTTSAAAEPSALVVRKWAPGLLDYRRRLGNREPTDPFESNAPAPEEGAESEGAESTGREGGEAAPPGEVESAPETPVGGAPVGGEETSETPEIEPANPEPRGEGTEEGELEKDQPSADAIDVRVTAVRAPGTKTPARTPYVGHQLPQLTKLPNENVAAFTYIGPSRDGKKAMLSISPEVSALLGASKCVSGSNPCQVLALQIGAPETFVYGPKGLTYRIELLRIGPESGSGMTIGVSRNLVVAGP